ncbi:MAG: hypothetical protein ACTSRG_12585 [Candidatus Helarchaeota archaeon]
MLISAILFPIFILIGTFTNLLISILIFFLISLTFFGIIGGIWLWAYLGESDLFKGEITIFPKIIGIISIIGLGIFTFFSFKVAFSEDIFLINQIIKNGTILLFFMCFYFIGYLISIWNPKEISQSESHKFKIKWKLSLIVFSILGLYCVIVFGILYIQFYNSLFLREQFQFNLMIFLLAGIGFALGWLFWEHLGELNLINGDFQKVLKIFSIISFIPLVILSILGLLILNSWDFYQKRLIILGYSLFIYLMFTYFIGLLISIFRK